MTHEGMRHPSIARSVADVRGLRSRMLLSILLILAQSPAAFAGQANALSSDDRAALARGEPIVRVTEAVAPADGAVFAAIDIAAPPSRVWAVLYDCAGATRFMENLKSCAVLESGPDAAWDIREHRVQWTSFLPELRSVFRSEYRHQASIRFQRVEGDLAFLDGEWTLVPLPGGKGTRLVYDTRVGFHALVPSFIVRNALTDDIPGFLKTIRAEVLRRG